MTPEWSSLSLSIGVSVFVTLLLLHHDDVDGAHHHLIFYRVFTGSRITGKHI